VALIRPLAWEPPHAAGVALGKAKRQEKKKKDLGRGYSSQAGCFYLLLVRGGTPRTENSPLCRSSGFSAKNTLHANEQHVSNCKGMYQSRI